MGSRPRQSCPKGEPGSALPETFSLCLVCLVCLVREARAHIHLQARSLWSVFLSLLKASASKPSELMRWWAWSKGHHGQPRLEPLRTVYISKDRGELLHSGHRPNILVSLLPVHCPASFTDPTPAALDGSVCASLERASQIGPVEPGRTQFWSWQPFTTDPVEGSPRSSHSSQARACTGTPQVSAIFVLRVTFAHICPKTHHSSSFEGNWVSTGDSPPWRRLWDFTLRIFWREHFIFIFSVASTGTGLNLVSACLSWRLWVSRMSREAVGRAI